MKKLVISLVIEGTAEDLHTIKGNIIRTASEALVSVTANEVEEQKIIKCDMFPELSFKLKR
ncbi:MAG: hypothetical protein IJX16_00280 [Clostridia bacterium]|nr:hypothetical protein [Clostridia bacterium]